MSDFTTNPLTGKRIRRGDYTFDQTGLTPDFRDRYESALDTYDPSLIEDTFWDKFANFFGFRSSADKARLQLKQSRSEAINQLVNQSAEQAYNSELEKAQRMRDAGMNPDLLGTGVASEATEGNEPEGRPAFDQLTTASDFASGFMNAFQSAISIASGIQGFQLNGVNLSDKVLDLGSKIRGKSIDILRDTLSSSELADFFKPDNSDGVNVYNWSDDTLISYGLRSPRARKMFRSQVQKLRDSYAGEIENYKSVEDYLKAQASSLTEQGAWYREKGNSDISVLTALRDFAYTLHNLEQIDAEYRTELSNYQKSFTGQLSPSDAADAVNAGNQFEADYKHSLNGQDKASAENALARYEAKKQKEMSDYFDKLIKSGDPLSILLYIQLMTNSNLLGSLNSYVSSAIVGSGVGLTGIKRGAEKMADIFGGIF